MRAQTPTSLRIIVRLGFVLGAAWTMAFAQTPVSLVVQTYAGLTVTGAVGTVYSVEYLTDLAQASTAGAWRCLEFLRLPASPYLWVDESTPATGQRFYRATESPIRANLVFIPPGTFRMGSPPDEADRGGDEGPVTEVIISRGFWMGKSEVTQGEYEAVMGLNPSRFKIDANHPVELVSWRDATNYCTRLTQRDQNAGLIPAGSAYRLPTEAEWEYACRAGTSTRFSYGDDPGYSNLSAHAWHRGNSPNRTHPVGQKLPNPWGLYDLHGNVRELCEDFLSGAGGAAGLPGGTVIDPRRSPPSTWCGTRGGAWDFDAQFHRSANRAPADRLSRDAAIGFRVVLAPGPTGP